MTDYIVNPRRSPRAPTRCRAVVQSRGASWAAETEDVGSCGCQLVAPSPLARGSTVELTVSAPGVEGALRVSAKVAWVGSQPPWRLGLSFDPASQAAAARWFEQLLVANPGLGSFRRVPDRLPVDAMVFLGPPPRFADFSADDLEVLRRIGNGATVFGLRQRLKESWATSQRILFALLSRGVLTLSRGAATHPEAWRRTMVECGVIADYGEAGHGPPALAYAPRPAPTVTPPPVPEEEVTLLPEAVLSAGRAEVLGRRMAGTGWRGVGQKRTAEAQEAFDLGKAELASGRSKVALALLRRALQLAPGDTEVATALGEAMKG